MNDYLSKPFRPRELKEAIERQIGGADKASSPALTPPVQAEMEVFNWAALVEMLMGDENIARKILASFLDTMPGKIAALKEALSQGNVYQVHLIGHSMKGIAASVKASALATVASDMEKAAREEDLAQAAPLMSIIEERYLAATKAIGKGAPG